MNLQGHKNLLMNRAVKGGFSLSGSWVSNSSIVGGLTDVGNYSSLTTYFDGSTLWLITGCYSGTFKGFRWNGTTWVSATGLVGGLTDWGSISKPTQFLIGGNWFLISGYQAGTFVVFKWGDHLGVEIIQ